MPYVIPHLLNPPINLKALAILSSVSGEATSRHLSKILPTLIEFLSTTSDQPNREQVRLLQITNLQISYTLLFTNLIVRMFDSKLCLITENYVLYRKLGLAAMLSCQLQMKMAYVHY